MFDILLIFTFIKTFKIASLAKEMDIENFQDKKLEILNQIKVVRIFLIISIIFAFVYAFFSVLSELSG